MTVRGGVCPNLPQRRSGPGLAAKKSAEYQRFSSGVPARSGPLWQIWTTCAVAGPSEGAAGGRSAVGRRSAGGPGALRRPDASNRMSFPPVSRVVSAGFGGEGGEGDGGGGVRPAGSGQASRPRGPPSSRGSTSGFPRPVRRSLLRRDDGRGLPCTHGRLGDGTGHRAPQPWRHPRPAVSHMQPAGPGGSPGGRLGESREMRCTRATADGPRDGTVTRRGPGPGSGRAGATTALPAAPAFRPDPDRIPRAPTCPTGLGSLRIRGRPRRNAPPRAPAGLGPRSSGPPGASESGPARLRPRGPVTGSCPAAP